MLESLLGVKEIEITELKNKVMEPLKKNTPNVLALKPPIPGDQLTADDIMSMDDEDNVGDYLVFRSLRQRMAMLAQLPAPTPRISPTGCGKHHRWRQIPTSILRPSESASLRTLSTRLFSGQKITPAANGGTRF